ncbi:hypothetical protein CO009_03775 [Candidatus Shapirobacteria bacterium CG_4_8_14_3_um_filter_35_11]|uniref:Uncharacterized protein n=1 Tax=Candidatus Shapirobacteria bacterium CG_4_8_14_3_um_filter_35_11 TaxID=1974874 RepID=A0A2M8GIT0_9BACT|nr:MAG: hypothetical protein CO009_03775 [Candidatus Shapirobacteria bacterium CG_4_8_14_3_um_filter_35_11]
MSKRKPFFEARDTFIVTNTENAYHGGYMALADSESDVLGMPIGYEVVKVETNGKRHLKLNFCSREKLRKNGRTNMTFYDNGREYFLPVYVKKLGKRPSPIDTAS